MLNQVGSCSVPLNPSTSEPPAMASAVSISSDTFSPSQGPNVKSYMLMLRVTVTRVSGTGTNGATTSEITNGDSDGMFIFKFIILFFIIITHMINPGWLLIKLFLFLRLMSYKSNLNCFKGCMLYVFLLHFVSRFTKKGSGFFVFPTRPVFFWLILLCVLRHLNLS